VGQRIRNALASANNVENATSVQKCDYWLNNKRQHTRK